MNDSLFVRVYETIARIPPGQVVTYGQIAMHLGQPHGARAVGWALRQCPDNLPWHRVVNAQGCISGGEKSPRYALQRALLEEEGILLDASGKIDLRAFGWEEI